MKELFTLAVKISLLISQIVLNHSISAQNSEGTSAIHIHGERVSGIFTVHDDLVSNNISKVAATDILNGLTVNLDKEVILVRGSHKQYFSFGSIAGFYKDGYKFRAYGSNRFAQSYGYYKIIRESGLIIYSKQTPAFKSGQHTMYYFSSSLNSPIWRLTKNRLRQEYRDEPEFTNAIIEAMKNNTLFCLETAPPLSVTDVSPQEH